MDIDLSRIEKKHILEAMKKYNELKQNGGFNKKRKGKNCILLYNGEEYYQKYLVGIAYGIATSSGKTLDSKLYTATGNANISSECILNKLGFELYKYKKFSEYLNCNLETKNNNTISTYVTDIKTGIKILQQISKYKGWGIRKILEDYLINKEHIFSEFAEIQERRGKSPSFCNSLQTTVNHYLEFLDKIKNGDIKNMNNNKIVTVDSHKLINDIENEKFIVQDNVENLKRELDFNQSQNIIFYGPPGTGKTYRTIADSVKLCEPYKIEIESYKKEYEELLKIGRIDFVTFHQSYDYEQFIEGISPVFANDDNDVSYELKDGIFKKIALLAASEGLESKQEINFDDLWDVLVQNINDGVVILDSLKKDRKYILEVSSSSKSINGFKAVVNDEDLIKENANKFLSASKKYLKIIWKYQQENLDEYINTTKVLDIIRHQLGTNGGCHSSFIIVVLEELKNINDTLPNLENINTTTKKIEKVKQEIKENGLSNFEFFDGKGIYKQLKPNIKHYVLIIDEINRGNISRILGELITILEPSKRIDEKDSMIVTLPYSQEKFAVPPNLHIIGTMNTADRSIALMDVALRRRFNFEELMPNVEIVKKYLRLDNVDKIFTTINKRIKFLYDRDHQLGHSIFMNIDNYDELHKVMLNDIIPMLQEYFYNDWNKICAVLGCPYDENGKPARKGCENYENPIITISDDKNDIILSNLDDYEEKQLDYEVNPKFINTKGQDLKKYFDFIM